MLFKIVNKQRKSDRKLGGNLGSNEIFSVIYSISIRKQMQKTWIFGNISGGAWPLKVHLHSVLRSLLSFSAVFYHVNFLLSASRGVFNSVVKASLPLRLCWTDLPQVQW